MTLLSTIEKPKDRPMMATIFGEAGMGKSTLACAFPKPIVIRVEDGLQSIPQATRPDAFPELTCVDDLWAQLASLCKEKHDYKTVVIDSVTALETMFHQKIVEDDLKAKSIATAGGGYGAGYTLAAAMHLRVLNACKILNKKGMHVIFIAHADMITIDLPDEEIYGKYSLRMHKKSLPCYLDEVGIVAQVRLESFVRGDEGQKKKAISTGNRLVRCYAAASSITKNRYGITEDIQFEAGRNPFEFLSIFKPAKTPIQKEQ